MLGIGKSRSASLRDTNGTVTPYALGIAPSDFDLIPPNQDLYCCDQKHNRLVKIPRTLLSNDVGHLLITQAGEVQSGALNDGRLFIVHWDAASTNFVIKTIPYFDADGNPAQLEHVTFAPISLSPLP
jgi:hypothetical protein